MTKLPRPKSTKWTSDTDLALEVQMIGLIYGTEGLSERKAIKKLVATWNFPYAPKSGRKTTKSDAKAQREEALLARWKDLKRRHSLIEAVLRLCESGEIKSTIDPLHFPSFEAHDAPARRRAS